MMKCVACGEKTDVTDSRATKVGVRRRRECRECGHRFTTYEGPAAAYRMTAIADEIRSDMRKAILLLNENSERFLTFERDIVEASKTLHNGEKCASK